MSTESKKEQWLVRASGRVLGPFTSEGLLAALKSREVVIHDEVARPMSRWFMMREVSELSRIIEELRREELGVENSGSATTPVGTDALSVSRTEPIDPYLRDDLTDEISVLSPEELNEIVIRPAEERRQQAMSMSPSLRGYGVSGSQQVRRTAERQSSRLVWVTFILVFLVLGFAVYQRWIVKPKVTQVDVTDYLSQGKSLIDIGDYSAALSVLLKAHSLDPRSTDVTKYLTPLLIQVDKNWTLARRLSSESIEGLAAAPHMAVTNLGVIEMMESNWTEAANRFREALKLNPDWEPAQINLALTRYKLEQTEEAYLALGKLDEAATQEPVPILALAQVAARLWNQKGERRVVEKAIAAIDRYVARYATARQEMNFVRLFLVYLLDGPQRLNDHVIKVLDEDAFQVNDYQYNLFVNRELTSWREWLPWCDQIYQQNQRNPLAATLMAFCLAKSGQISRANSIMLDLSSQGALQPIQHLVMAFVFHEIQRKAEYKLAVQQAAQSDPNSQLRTPRHLQAQLCWQSGQATCAETYWRSVLSSDRRHLGAIAGLAWLAYEAGQFGLALERLQIGLQIEPSHSPLLKLNAKPEIAKLDSR